ncbi:MAG: hypothetical protein WC028_31525 [Candidatus Obscuribacterales bacterium]|jgi:hypothetical protein
MDFLQSFTSSLFNFEHTAFLYWLSKVLTVLLAITLPPFAAALVGIAAAVTIEFWQRRLNPIANTWVPGQVGFGYYVKHWRPEASPRSELAKDFQFWGAVIAALSLVVVYMCSWMLGTAPLLQSLLDFTALSLVAGLIAPACYLCPLLVAKLIGAIGSGALWSNRAIERFFRARFAR